MNKNTILPTALVAALIVLGSNSIAQAKSTEEHRTRCPVEKMSDKKSQDKEAKNYHKYSFKKGVLKSQNRHRNS